MEYTKTKNPKFLQGHGIMTLRNKKFKKNKLFSAIVFHWIVIYNFEKIRTKPVDGI